MGRCICLLPFSFDLANHIREMPASFREMQLSMQDGESLTFFPNAVPTVARKDPRTGAGLTSECRCVYSKDSLVVTSLGLYLWQRSLVHVYLPAMLSPTGGLLQRDG